MNPNRNESPIEMEPSFLVPPANIRESKDEVIVEVEMPGVDKERLEVSMDGDELTITGRRRREKAEGTPVWQEIRSEDFRRTFTIGDHINRSAVNAAFENGVLTLRLGKAEDVKPRRIEVQFA